MSQSQLFGSSLFCQPISKYSHSAGRAKQAPVWSHIIAPNLSVLVEHVQYGSQIRLRVIQDATDLVDIPFTAYVQAANNLRQLRPDVQIEKLPIFGMAKALSLAIRILHPNDQVQRIQVRLETEAVCGQLAKFLEDQGLQFSTVYARPSTAGSQDRPASVGSRHVTSSFTAPLPSVHTPTIHVPHYESPSQHEMLASQIKYNPTSSSFAMTSTPYGRREQPSSILVTPMPPSSTQHLGTVRQSDRPVTAPDQNTSTTLQDLLPPRRELPFNRPSTASNASEKSTRSPKSSNKRKALSPLPQPSYVQESSSSTFGLESSEKSGSSSHPSSPPTHILVPHGPTKLNPPTRRMYSARRVCFDGDIYGQEASSPCAKNGELESIPVSEASNSLPPSSPSRRPTTADQINAHLSSTNDMSEASTMAADSHGGELGRYNEQSREDLRRFAEQSDEVRMQQINKFIIDHLNDESFIQLCEDVANCWQTQILGGRRGR